MNHQQHSGYIWLKRYLTMFMVWVKFIFYLLIQQGLA